MIDSVLRGLEMHDPCKTRLKSWMHGVDRHSHSIIGFEVSLLSSRSSSVKPFGGSLPSFLIFLGPRGFLFEGFWCKLNKLFLGDCGSLRPGA